MKKIVAILLVCVFCLGGCALYTPKPAQEEWLDGYMGTWKIYTNTEADGGTIGNVTFAKTGEDTISVEITDFIGGVDITGVKNAKFTKKDIRIAESVETVQNHGEDIALYFNFEQDENLKESVVIDFIIPGDEPRYALESLYLYR